MYNLRSPRLQNKPFVPHLANWDPSTPKTYNYPVLGLPSRCDSNEPIAKHLIVGEITAPPNWSPRKTTDQQLDTRFVQQLCPAQFLYSDVTHVEGIVPVDLDEMRECFFHLAVLPIV